MPEHDSLRISVEACSIKIPICVYLNENALNSREASLFVYNHPKACLRLIIFRGDSLHSIRELKRHGPGP